MMELSKWDKYLYFNYSPAKNRKMVFWISTFSILLFFTPYFLLKLIGLEMILLSLFVSYKIEVRYRKVADLLQKEKDRYYQQCVKACQRLESVLDRIPYLTEKDKKWMLNNLWFELNHYCLEIQNYQYFLKKVQGYIAYFEARAREYRQQYSSKRHNPGSITKYLEVLGLPKDTSSWELIKARYRQLMKKYHPDYNSSSEALQTTQKINGAYAELEKYFLFRRNS